ncbi:MAG: calcium-binding protein [Pelagimonas sp.]|jgi:hypothetical protein|nr:calcium-binding protein [Pelagimonas sp.]
MIRRWLGILTLALTPTLSVAERDSVKTYMFGNSLVNHLSEESEHTNVPHWVNEMAKADGRRFALDGQWGFMRSFVDRLPPTSNWGFPGVRGVWSTDAGPFSSSGFDSVVITPANFIQYQQPDVPYDGENANNQSPLGAMLELMDWVIAETPDMNFLIYEGWSDMGSMFNDFPINRRQARKYHAHNAGPYHDWFVDLQDRVRLARPKSQVDLIPVAAVLAQLLGKDGLMADIPVQELYEDSAPHGRPDIYLLAAMVTYSTLYQVPPPASFDPPATMHPALVENYPQIAEFIWQAVPKLDRRSAEATPEKTSLPLPKRQDVDLPPRNIRPTGMPALAFGLNGISDWSTQHPFIDIMKSSRAWVGHIGDDWGGFSNERLVAEGYLDENGWPKRLPAEVSAIESVILTSQPEGSDNLRTDYVLTYKGQGRIRLVGSARRARYEDGRVEFSFEPGGEGSLVGIKINKLDESDPIRDIHVYRKDHQDLFEAGAIFNPDWIEVIQDARSVRFMDWMLTNGSPVTNWQERPRISQGTWTQWGVPLEVMIRLANKIGADPWFTMPHRADDDYVRRFAEVVKRDLDPGLKAYVEYSNEVWNRIFPQAQWAEDQATAKWGKTDRGWMQYYGMRAAQVADIWTDVFGDETDARLVRVIATHTGWPGLEEYILLSPLGYLTNGKPPRESFDAYAVTGYFGYEMGGEDMSERMNDWLDRAEAEAEKKGKERGLQRVALREFVKKIRFDGAITPVAEALAQGSLRDLTEEIFPYHAGVAARNDLTMIMYEGGTHVSGHGPAVNDERLTAFFTTFNYTPEMAKLYEQLLNGWVNAGGKLFNAFVDVSPDTKWGSWGAKRYLEDQNPRWDMLMAYNAVGPNEWEQRDAKVFDQGITRVAGAGNQSLQGTSFEDVLIAGPGNDTLISSGGFDILHGGRGTDRAVLPGARDGYDFERDDGDRLMAKGPKGDIWLTAIEEIVFDAAPTQSIAASEF